MPPNPQTVPADFYHNKQQMATKKMSVNASLNIVHQFLVFQVYVPEGEPFNLELHIRDKNNVSKTRGIFHDKAETKIVMYCFVCLVQTQIDVQ